MSSKKILFTGITGLLGGYFLKSIKPGFKIIGIGNKNIQGSSQSFFKIDITNKNKLSQFIKKINPKVIIHGAAIGNVDYCEKHPDEAFEVNVKGTNNMINAAKSVEAKIIFLSSNAVYDGENPPYSEESILNPLDVYGQTKMEGENLIKKSGLDFVILRLITMYGWPNPGGRSNPVTWVIDNLKRGEKINVVSDIYNNHLFAGQAAEVLWKVIQSNIENEIYNISGSESINRFELALKVAKVFGLDASLINPVRSDFFKDIAIRPKNTSFNPSKMKKKLKVKPLSVEEGLRLMRQERSLFFMSKYGN